MASSPTISVIVPTYNGAAFIAEALKSIFAQSLLPSEVVVIDDCSRDGTQHIVEQTCRQYKPAQIEVQIQQMAANSGSPAAPIKMGVEHSRGELIAVLEQDDVFLPSKIERQVLALRDQPDAVMAFGLCRQYGTQDKGVRSQHPHIVRVLRSLGVPKAQVFESRVPTS